MTARKKKDKITKDISGLKFEQAFTELKDATERLENEEIDLESTLSEYSRASELARHCANLLDVAEKQIQVLIENEGVIEPADLDEQ